MSLVRELAYIGAGVAVGLAWLTIWAYLLRAPGFSPLLQRTAEDRDSRRERMKQMGKPKYILIYGVLGTGLAFGLAMITADLLRHNSLGWASEVPKLVFLAVSFGWWQGARSWRIIFRDPVPFPPNYPPAKTKQGYF